MTRIPSHFVRKTVALLGAALLMLDMFTCCYSCLLFLNIFFVFLCLFFLARENTENIIIMCLLYLSFILEHPYSFGDIWKSFSHCFLLLLRLFVCLFVCFSFS